MKKIKVLVFSFLSIFGLINFGYCDLITYPVIEGTYILTTNSRNQEIITNGDDVCVYGVGDSVFGVYTGDPFNGGSFISVVDEGYIYCSNVDFLIRNNSDYQTLTILYGGKPIISSLDCQTEYNLIPVDSVDSQYCVSNGLCPSSDCSGSVISSGDWSALFINDIQHQSAGIINITIPEEFDWDYTGNDEVFDLDVKGYNTDSDYIAGIITTQRTTPNSEDFNNIVSGIIPLFVPGLVIILFIYFVFRFIKKIF